MADLLKGFYFFSQIVMLLSWIVYFMQLYACAACFDGSGTITSCGVSLIQVDHSLAYDVITMSAFQFH